MVVILMMPVQLATLLKIKPLGSAGYGVIISVHDVTNEVFSSYSNYIVDVVMLPKFGNSRISFREVIRTSIL